MRTRKKSDYYFQTELNCNEAIFNMASCLQKAAAIVLPHAALIT